MGARARRPGGKSGAYESWQCADSMQELECRLTRHSQDQGICSELNILASQVRTLKSSVGIRSLKVVKGGHRDGLEAPVRSGVWREGGQTVPL